MQFVPNGPEVPDELVQAHEEGRVVFFCGAGISYPAGLPNFEGLVEQIYKRVGTVRLPFEQAAFERGQFDAALDLLERRLPGQRFSVRRALAQALKPSLRRKGATDTHSALLQLAHSRKGTLRLVTTNFDRVFDTAAKRSGQKFQAYAAPMLPIPKNSRWNGLVYLHGMLPDKVDETSLNRLVVTSGDFGLAYLTERWAARFVSELFRNYVVCFVGYSINDPVLRYMMDALAADRMLGESTQRAWALGDCEPGEEADKTIEWAAKGVTPILYEVPHGTHDHSALHKTLHTWAETYRDGVVGKERIVVSHALARPSASTKQDNFVGRMLWALSDDSGLPAKQFADFNPVPSLEWLLESFSEERYLHSDLKRFGVPPKEKVDETLRFSLVRRPSAYSLAPRMLLVSSGSANSRWDDVMHQLGRWLIRHLNDPALVIWIAQHGGQLHSSFASQIEGALDHLSLLEATERTVELDEIRAHAPNGIPGPLMQTLWRLLLSGRVKTSSHEPDIYRWSDRLKRNGLTPTLRLELRDLLAPKIDLKKPIVWGDELESGDETSRTRRVVGWDLVLSADNVDSFRREMEDERWKSAQPLLLEDFQQLLRDALDLLHELGDADEYDDQSHWHLPSISQHWQNRGFHDWVSLIELLRDAWLALRSSHPDRANRIALAWFELPYATFKRLAFFAASQDNCIAPSQWLEWLLVDNSYWLWSENTKREVLRLLVLQGRQLAKLDKDRLEAAILVGPPRKLYVDKLKTDEWTNIVERSIWLHFNKLRASGVDLGEGAKKYLTGISTKHLQWQIAANESDEFSHWMSGTGDPDYEENRDIEIAPRKRHELVQWLQQPLPDRRPFYEHTWRETCRTRFFHSVYALCDLAKEGVWPEAHWREALQTWSEEGQVLRSWRYAAPLVKTMPEPILQDLVRAVSWWLDAAAKLIDRHEDIMLDLCRRILVLPLEAGSGITRDGKPINQPVTEAINHPIGHVTQAMLNRWFKREPNDNDRLPTDFELFFTQLCDIRVERYRHGRVLMGSRLISFFRVDRVWTEQHLLPLLDWDSNLPEARAMWEGFLWSPRLYIPLLIRFKTQFLQTARHYADLGEHGRQFAAILTYAALESIEGYAHEDFRIAVGELPQQGLQESAQALSQALEGAGDQREDYWKNRIQPFWHRVWPKSLTNATPSISASLVRISIAAGTEFPAALLMVQDWLRPIEHPHLITQLLNKSGLCIKYPADALQLLNLVTNGQGWPSRELKKCLDAIAQAAPTLVQDPRYQRLLEHSRQRGIE